MTQARPSDLWAQLGPLFFLTNTIARDENLSKETTFLVVCWSSSQYWILSQSVSSEKTPSFHVNYSIDVYLISPSFCQQYQRLWRARAPQWRQASCARSRQSPSPRLNFKGAVASFMVGEWRQQTYRWSFAWIGWDKSTLWSTLECLEIKCRELAALEMQFSIIWNIYLLLKIQY